MNKNKIPLLDKYELNKYIHKLSEYNNKYYLILKMAYTYGVNISEIATLKKTHITDEVICFHTQYKTLKYQLIAGLKKELNDYINTLSEDKEYLFIEDDADDIKSETRRLSRNTTEFIITTNRDIKKNYNITVPYLNVKDFKRLRGQHLILDGVPFETVHRLYHNSNKQNTRRFLHYDDLLNQMKVYEDDINETLQAHTDFDLYYDRSVDETQIYSITSMEDEEYVNVLEIASKDKDFALENNDNDIASLLTVDKIWMLFHLKHGEFKKLKEYNFTRI